MKYINSLLIILSLFTSTAYAQEDTNEKFPKTGYVKDGAVEVKAGDNINFETICVLSKSEPVRIIDKRYSWYKILLPRKAFLYISKDYVSLTSDEKGIGIVNAGRVNLRAGAGTRYSIIGQVSKPEKVLIISEDNGWYKIEPPYGSAGWVQSNQVVLSEQKETELRHSEKIEEKAAPKTTAQKKDASNPTVRLNTNYPMSKGNLSISTKGNR